LFVRNGMPGDEPRGPPWQHSRLCGPDADSRLHTNVRALYELCQHRTCRLANGNDVDRRRAHQRISDRSVAKSGSDEPPRIRRANGCTQDLL
jgi:hypothetical protein